MGIKKLTPTSPSRRYQTYLTRDELTKGAEPEKCLLEPKTRISGRNNRIFNVQVDAVRTINYAGKVKRRGRIEGRRPGWKKAYVTLKAGQQPLDYGEAI